MSNHGDDQRWEQPDFGPLPSQEPTPPQAQRKERLLPKFVAGVVAVGVTALIAKSCQAPMASTDSTSPAPNLPTASTMPFETPSPTATASPEPTRTVTVTATPSTSASEQPTAKETDDSHDFTFTPGDDRSGTLSGPAATWDEGYRNVIRFTCKNSIATTVLSVQNEQGKTVKTYDKTTLKGPLFRLCIGNTVSEKVPEHPEAYYRVALAGIIAKDHI